MTSQWDKFAKGTFYEFIEDIDDFDDFFERIVNLEDKKLKGDLFEYFAKLYFELLPSNKKQYEHFYLYADIPAKIKKYTKLPTKDKGIDGILIDYNNNIYAVQIKFRSDRKIIPFGDLATFPALAFGTGVEHISGGVMFTTCIDVCDELNGDKYTNITYDSFDKCDTYFWKKVRKYILKQKIDDYLIMKPLPHQEIIFPLIKTHYEENDNGRLYLPCGTGKTFIGYWSAIKILNMKKTVIIVPSLYLLSETYNTWIIESQYLNPQIYFTLIGSDINNRNECEYKPTTDVDMIINYLTKYKNDNHVVITTYQSCDLLLKACIKLAYKFDIGIFDEAHRTTGDSDNLFTCLLSNKYNICKKRMFMTATEKIYNIPKSFTNNKLKKEDIEDQVLSMDNENVYGEVIYKYSTRQAIDDKQLVDYKLIAPFLSTNTYDTMIDENKIIKLLNKKYEMKLILLCCIIKNAMEACKFTHLLIFSNSNDNAKKIFEILAQLIKDEDLYIKCLSGNDNMTIRRSEVTEFEKAKKGIISSARIFGEGVNIKICDAVCFADNKASSVDIVQCVGRCLRKYAPNPYKMGYVLVPFLIEKYYDDEFYDNFLTNENESFMKLRRVLKSLGDTDDIITEKFVLMDCGKKQIKKKDNDKKEYKSSFTISTTNSFNLNTFAQHIISKIFDRTGDRDTRIRNMIIHENERRWKNGDDLIDTKEKYITFLKDTGIEEKYPKPYNLIKFLFGNKLFAEIQKIYCYDKKEFSNICKKLKISSSKDYEIKRTIKSKLPPYHYIDNGFYCDLDHKFNLQKILNIEDTDV